MNLLDSPLWKLGQRSKALQRRLKALGQPPPPPAGRAPLADVMKPGRFYEFTTDVRALERYVAVLQAALAPAGTRWSPAAHGHSVLMAAQRAAPPRERLTRPHAGAPARPLIDAVGYVHAGLEAARAVAHLVAAGGRRRFTSLVALGQRVASGRELTARDRRLLDTEVPRGKLATGALTRLFTAPTGALRVAQGIAIDAGHAALRGVAGKGAREACVHAVQLLASRPGAVRTFLERLDAVLLREDARCAFARCSVKPSSAVKHTWWRGAARGTVTHWLVELERGAFALVWKVKGRWRLVEGAREDVLACVSDSHLRAATEALLG
jgi:hypothetical protein